MAADHDTPQAPEGSDDRNEDLPIPRGDARPASVDAEDTDDLLGSPGAEMFDEDLTVIPIGADEFRCDRCFLVHHRSRLVAAAGSHDLPRLRLIAVSRWRPPGAGAARCIKAVCAG